MTHLCPSKILSYHILFSLIAIRAITSTPSHSKVVIMVVTAPMTMLAEIKRLHLSRETFYFRINV